MEQACSAWRGGFCRAHSDSAAPAPGTQAWHLQLDVHALDQDGNLLDACMLSALAALMAFRRPDTEVTAAPGEGAGSTVTLLLPDVREPLPLSLHQLPLAVTFALFEVGGPSHELLPRDMSLCVPCEQAQRRQV